MADLAWYRAWLADAPVRVLDTVTLDGQGRPTNWFYTSSKTGKVATKDAHQLTWPKIGRRFAKFALASQENTGRRVAVLLRHDGARAILGEQELAAVARADDQTRATMLEGVGGVQVYLGDGDDYWCRCEAVDKVDGESKTTAGLGASPSPLASHVDDALGKYTRSLRLKAKEPCVEARFVADAHGQFWLSDVQRAGWSGPTQPVQKKRAVSQKSRPKTGGQKLRPLSEKAAKRRKKKDIPVESSRPLFEVHEAARQQAISASSPRTAASLALPTPWEQEIQAAKRKQFELLASASDEPSLFAPHEATVMTEAPPLETPAAPPPPGSARAFAQQALTDRITTLESQIGSCEERASRAEELRDKTLQKCRELGAELTNTKTSLEEQLQDKQVQLEVVTLQMETLRNTKTVNVPAPVIKTGDTNIDEVLQKLHKKEQAFIDAKQAWALERQALISDKQRTNTQSQYQLHVQSNELRAQLAEAEDKVQSLTTECAEAKAALKIVEQDNHELRDEVETFRAAKRELGEGSSTAGQVARGAMSLQFGAAKQTFGPDDSLITAHTDKAETLRAAEAAKGEAKIRQLHNKVVFLKSSLEMEMDAKSALEKDLRQARAMLQQEREENEQRLADAVTELNSAVESAEARAHSAVAEAHDRASHLETKLASAQAAYSDAVHDAGAARRREEQIKGELRREKAQKELREKTLKEQTEKLAQLRSQEMGELSSEDRQRQEEKALIRRLENEKQYLAAQLKSEATCKGELQSALDKAEERLVETEAQGHKALQNSLESVRKSADRASAAEKELRAVRTEKEAQDVALTKQIEMLKEGYVKTRDALRIEQHHTGRLKIQVSELMDSAGSLREQIERLEQDRKDDQSRASEDKDQYLIALKDREKKMRLEAEESRKKLRDHYENLQEVRAKELELRQDFIELQKSVSKAGRLGLALGAAGVGSNKRQKALDALESKVNDSFFGDKYQVPWLRREGCKAFATWRIYTLKTKAAEENRANVAQAVHEALTRSRDAHEESVESLVARLKEERDAAVACSNAVSLLDGLEVVERKMRERDEERDTAREISRGQVDNLKNIITKEKEKAASIDRARLELKHLLSEAEDATKIALAEGAERAEKASRASAADYDYSAALLAARTARCKASISATKFDLERAPAELREEVQRLTEEVERCDQFATHAVREAVKAAGAFEALDSATGDIAGYRRTADLAADRAGAAIACAGAAARTAENCCLARTVAIRRDATLHERREVTKNAAGAALELKKVKEEASSALLEKQDQLETAIYAIHAAEVAGTAALELIKHEKQAVQAAVQEKEALVKKWARDWHKSTDRHKAADVACLAVRAELSRVEYAFDEKFNEAEKAADACARAAIANAKTEVAEKWRQSVANAEERGTAKEATAWRRGMEERDALARKETEKLKATAEKALSEVKRSAAQSLKDVQAKTKAALEKAALAAQEREEEAVARTDAKARREERTLREDSEQAIVACSTARLKLEVDQLGALHRRSERARDVKEEKLQERFDSELEKLRQAVKSERDHNQRELETSEKLQKQHQTALALADERLRDEVSLLIKREAEKTDALRAFDACYGARLHLEVLDMKDMEAVKSKKAAVSKAVAKAEKHAQEVLIPPLVLALDDSKALSAAYEAQLAQASRQWDDERDRVVDLRGEVAFQRRQHALREWRTAAKAVVQEKKAEQRERNASRAAKEVERMLTLQLRRTERKAAFVRTQLEEQIEEGEAFRGRMHDTLVNHERATLVAHKRRSTELGMELEVIVRDRDELEAERDKILEYVDEMQESVRAIEQAIHAHSKNSAISSDGRVNVAHAKKKKRMDDDHEMLLLGVEKQRNALSETDARLQRLNDARERKEDDMKELERRLVELLVSQQKKLLAILQEAAHATRELDERTPREDEFADRRPAQEGVYAS